MPPTATQPSTIAMTVVPDLPPVIALDHSTGGERPAIGSEVLTRPCGEPGRRLHVIGASGYGGVHADADGPRLTFARPRGAASADCRIAVAPR